MHSQTTQHGKEEAFSGAVGACPWGEAPGKAQLLPKCYLLVFPGRDLTFTKARWRGGEGEDPGQGLTGGGARPNPNASIADSLRRLMSPEYPRGFKAGGNARCVDTCAVPICSGWLRSTAALIGLLM